MLYIVWGGDRELADVTRVLNRSIESLARWCPGLPHHVVQFPDGTSLPAKATMADLSPFDETLFLDADTVLLDDIDYGFERAAQFGLACCISVAPWARRYEALMNEGDLVEYDTGVLFFTRKAAPVFEAWKAYRAIPSASLHYIADELHRMNINDQAGFAAAIRDTGFNPYVLPVNYNCHPSIQKSICGPLKVWHAWQDAPDAVLRWNEEQSQPGAVMKFMAIVAA